ncbi:cell division protein ZipA [Gammaproteobacteria bacterium]
MNFVRIILILFGFGFLLGIWWWERQRRVELPRHEREVLEGIGIEIRTEGSDVALDFSGLDGITATNEHISERSLSIVSEDERLSLSMPSMVEEKLIVFNLMAPVDRPYSGQDLLTAIQGANLVYGEMSIFHHRIKGLRRPIFSMANLVEPGTFNPPAMDGFFTPGLTFFMRLPGQIVGPRALDLMFKSAQHLVNELGGNLCDQHRYPLDQQNIAKLRDEVAKHQQCVDNINKMERG